MYCSKCGKEIMDEAIICPNCGCATGNSMPKAVNKDIIQTISQRININGIIWIVVAALQIIIGIFSWITLIVGVLNLVSAIQDIKYSKVLPTNPVGLVEKVKPLTMTIITFVYNLVIGGVIGIAGSIYYFIAVRGFVLENEQEFLKIEEQHKTTV